MYVRERYVCAVTPDRFHVQSARKLLEELLRLCSDDHLDDVVRLELALETPGCK